MTSSRPPAGPGERGTARVEWWLELGFWSAAAVLVVVAGRARAIGLDPQTLWHDDAWVAALTRLGLWDAVAAPTNAPPGFVGLSWAAARLFGDPELSLQVLPFGAALAAIPVVMWVVARLTESRSVGVAAGALVVMSPAHVHYSVFVKQYTLGFLGVALVLGLASRWLDRPDRWRTAALGAVATITATVGYGAALAVAVLTNTAIIADGVRRRAVGAPLLTARSLGLLAGFNTALLVYYVVLLRPRAAGEPDPYWQNFFLPVRSPGAALEFLQRQGHDFLAGAFPANWSLVLWLVMIGLAWLACRRGTRWVAAATGLMAAGLLVVSGRHLYPIGAGRTDIFAYPVILVLSAVGVAALTHPLGRARRPARAALAVAAVTWAVVGAPGVSYFELDLSAMAETLDRRAKSDDGIVVYPAATFLTTHYTDIPAELLTVYRGVPYFAMRRDGSLALPPDDPAEAGILAADFLLRGDYPRIWFFTTRSTDEYPHQPFVEMIERRGYRERQRWSSRIRSHLVLYERVVAPGRTQGAPQVP